MMSDISVNDHLEGILSDFEGKSVCAFIHFNKLIMELWETLQE